MAAISDMASMAGMSSMATRVGLLIFRVWFGFVGCF